MRPLYEQDQKAIEQYLLAVREQDHSELIAKAEEAMQGMLILNGTGAKPVFVGIPPKWEENPYGVGGFIWTMSRLRYMITLCRAFLVTGERRYLDKVETDLTDWLNNVPPPPVPHDQESANVYHGVHNWRMLELGYRMVYVFPVLRSMLRVHGKNRELVRRIDLCIAQHAERIAAGSHLLWPRFDHNHYTQEINGLLSAVSMIPEHPKAKIWMAQAMEGLEKASANQLTPDGAQIEGAFDYHAAVVMDFCYSVHFASLLGQRFSDAFIQRLKKGIAYCVHSLSPDGNMIPYGDAEQKVTSPIVAAMMGYMLFREETYLHTVHQFIPAGKMRAALTSTLPWGFSGLDDLLSWLDHPESESKLLPLTACQRQMDQYITRTGWDRDAAFLFFSCHSPIHYGNHAHMDQLGVIFGAYGKALLQDPGRYTYKDGEDRHLFKSSQVHNVPTIDGKDGFEYISTFRYGPQKEGKLITVQDTGTIRSVTGMLHNYEPAVITRTAALIDGKFLLLADTFEHAGGHSAHVFFQLNTVNAQTGENCIWTADEDANVYLAAACSEGKVQIQLLDGRLSDVFYHAYPSKRVLFAKPLTQEQETVFFLALPCRGKETPNAIQFKTDDNEILIQWDNQAYRLRYQNHQLYMKQ